MTERRFEADGYYAPLDERSESVELTGKLVDMRCYALDLRNHDSDHLMGGVSVDDEGKLYKNGERLEEGKGYMKNCAQVCARKGVPVGLIPLREGENLPRDAHLSKDCFVLLTAAPALENYMSKQVRIVGRLMHDSNALLVERLYYEDDEINLMNPMG
jgi:hypothetical protein